MVKFREGVKILPKVALGWFLKITTLHDVAFYILKQNATSSTLLNSIWGNFSQLCCFGHPI